MFFFRFTIYFTSKHNSKKSTKDYSHLTSYLYVPESRENVTGNMIYVRCLRLPLTTLVEPQTLSTYVFLLTCSPEDFIADEDSRDVINTALLGRCRPPTHALHHSNEMLHPASIIFYEKFFRFEIYTLTFES